MSCECGTQSDVGWNAPAIRPAGCRADGGRRSGETRTSDAKTATGSRGVVSTRNALADVPVRNALTPRAGVSANSLIDRGSRVQFYGRLPSPGLLAHRGPVLNPAKYPLRIPIAATRLSACRPRTCLAVPRQSTAARSVQLRR